MELVPICDEYPLSKKSHFVAGIQVPAVEVLENSVSLSFQVLYASLRVAIIGSVLDGDCAFDVMTMMLGIPFSLSARTELRIELSDYLLERIGDPWLLDIMVACQELRLEDVNLYRSGKGKIMAASPAPVPAVADPALAAVEQKDFATPDEETFSAMRWTSKDSCTAQGGSGGAGVFI